MSKGLSKLQQEIVGLLGGSIRREVFRGSGALTTGELLEELQCRGVVRDDAPKKIAMFTVRRACNSLLQRGLVDREYEIHCDYPWAKVAVWTLKETRKPAR